MKWRMERLQAFIFYTVVYFFIGHLLIDFMRLTLPNPPIDYLFTVGLWITMFITQIEFFIVIGDKDNASPFKFAHRKVVIAYNVLMLPLVIFYAEQYANLFFIIRMLVTVAYLMISSTLHRYEKKLKSRRWILWTIVLLILVGTAIYFYA